MLGVEAVPEHRRGRRVGRLFLRPGELTEPSDS
jgi:hypothetical protein